MVLLLLLPLLPCAQKIAAATQLCHFTADKADVDRLYTSSTDTGLVTCSAMLYSGGLSEFVAVDQDWIDTLAPLAGDRALAVLVKMINVETHGIVRDWTAPPCIDFSAVFDPGAEIQNALSDTLRPHVASTVTPHHASCYDGTKWTDGYTAYTASVLFQIVPELV